ncbi:MAG: flagellar hook-associated protein FlgK [Gemmatimonadota bacterium]
MPASLNGILSIARSGLLTHQLALQVTGNNLANATTEGYSRQRAELVPSTPILFPEGSLGTGVRVADITRARNVLLDDVHRRESSLFFGFSTKYSALSNVEATLAETSDLSLGAALDGFWSSWSDLANDPSSATGRSVVVARAEQLVDQIRRIDSSLDVIGTQVAASMQTSVGRVNDILSEIAQLNGQIAGAMSGGNSAPNLADQRDRLLDELAEFLPIESTPRDTGAVGVVADGISLVEGVSAQSLSLSFGSGTWALQTTSGAPISTDRGSIGGALSTLNTDFVAIRAQLDELAQGLVERVNAIHVTGTNPLGGTGLNFFDDFGDPTTVTAQTLSLDAAILADAQAVAAGTADGGGNYQAGENDVALLLAGLRDDTSGSVLAGRSINTAYRDFVADVGLRAASANEAVQGHAVLVRSTGEARESVSGVATDEELVKVVQLQAAYGAAARLVSTVDEMYQTILSI